jgi:NCS1 family nucleobase:cation symporter-1
MRWARLVQPLTLLSFARQIKGRKVDIPARYDPRARYRYNKYGINWRALVALLIAVGPCMPGFCNSIQPSIPLIQGMQRFYTVAWVYGTVSSITIYMVLYKVLSAYVTKMPLAGFKIE